MIIILGVSIIAKIALLGKGYLSLPDEFRYIAAQDFIEFFKKENLILLCHSFLKFKEDQASL